MQRDHEFHFMKIRLQQYSLPGRGSGPLARFAAVLVAAIVIASALVLGFVFFVVILGLMLFAWLALLASVWFRSGGERQPSGQQKAGNARSAATLEGEFKVVEGQSDGESHRDGQS